MKEFIAQDTYKFHIQKFSNIVVTQLSLSLSSLLLLHT